MRVQTYTRYGNFVKKLSTSPSKDIRFLRKILLNDPRSTIWKNVWYLNNITNMNILVVGKAQVRSTIPVSPIPALDQWRVGLLNVLLETRTSKNYSNLNLSKKQFDEMLESLCKS